MEQAKKLTRKVSGETLVVFDSVTFVSSSSPVGASSCFGVIDCKKSDAYKRRIAE